MKPSNFTKAAAVLAGIALLTGCSAPASPSSPVTSNVSQAAQAYEPVTIQNGERTLIFTQMPKKVLCCNLYSAENMVMLGLEDYIAGKNVPKNAAEKPLPELSEQFKDIPEIERSHENAVALEADLIIGQVSAFKEGGSNSWGSYQQFENEGIHCLTITGTIVEDETVEHMYQDIENLGKIFHVEERAAELIAQIKGKIADTQEKVKGIAEDKKVKAFVLDTFNGNEIYTTSSGLESNLIELAGGVNVTRGMANSRWFHTSVETLVSANPDIIILNDYGTQTIEEKLDFLNNNPALQDVPAVKNQKFLIIPLVAVMQDARAADACQTFAKTFYPECFA